MNSKTQTTLAKTIAFMLVTVIYTCIFIATSVGALAFVPWGMSWATPLNIRIIVAGCFLMGLYMTDTTKPY